MRSTVFLLMFALCLVALECAANAEEENPQKGTENGEKENKLLNPTADQRTHGVPQPKLPLSELPADVVATTTTTVQDALQSSLSQSSADQQLLQQQQQQQQQQLSQTGTGQGTGHSQKESDGTKQNGDGAGLISSTEIGVRSVQDVNRERSEGGDKSQPKPNEASQPLKEQPPPSSQSATSGVKETEKNTLTTAHTSDHTNAQNLSSAPPNTEGTHNKPASPQVQQPIITNVKTTVNDTTKTPNTTGASATPQSSKQEPQSHTKDTHVNTLAPPPGITGHTGVNPSDKDQHHSTPTSQTSSGSNGLSPNTTPQTKKVTTPHLQPVSQEKPQAAPSKSVQSQAPAQTLDSDKTKKTVNGITPSLAAATPANKKPIIPNIPATTATAAPNNAASMTNTTAGDKETNPMQTSVSSTSEPVKGESTPHGNNTEKLSKALYSLDNKDNSIGVSLACALAAVATLVLVAIAPAF